MFINLLNKIKSLFEPEIFRFVKNLCEKEQPEIFENHFHIDSPTFILLFSEVKICMKYELFFNKWVIEIISNNIVLYYYNGYLGWTPYKTINYLMDRFKLKEKLNKMIEKYNDFKKKEKETEKSIKLKYLNC